jgi:MHS family citrate/tricarballylate:H+ symporter-like MFS transporter
MTYAAAPTADARAPGVVLKRHVAAAVAGNALEFYDFVTYTYFAIQIGDTFFPNKSHFISLMVSLSTFGVGFLMRPVGALVLGRYADRAGRRPAMMLTLALMGVAVLGLALTPGYAQIGLAAPILALAWRLLQGFALGGETGPTTAYLIEAAPPEKRGLYAAWQPASQSVAFFAGGVVGFSVAHLGGSASLETWGWRLALGLGALILPFGFWLRRTLPETLHTPEEGPRAHPPRAVVSEHVPIFLIALALIGAGTVGTYVLTYMTTYAVTTLHVTTEVSLAIPIFTGLTGFTFSLVGGWLADRYGRKPFIIGTRAALILLSAPIFWLIVRNHDAITLLAASALISVILNLGAAALYAGLVESMHRELRGVGFSTVYALPVAILGGATQPFLAWLIHVTGDRMTPAWCMMAVNAVGLVAALAFRESAHVRLVSKEV